MKLKYDKTFYRIFALALIALVAIPFGVFASAVDVSVVDVLAPTGSVTVTPGASASITINMTVTGKQETEATFQVFSDWTLSAGTFTGSNAQTFTVHPRAAQDPATTFSTTGNISVASGQTVGTFTLAVSAINISNTGTGAKLSDGADSSYQVTVSAPSLTTTTTTVTCPASVTYTGAAQTPCTATVTGAGGLNQSLTISYSNNTAVGTATASASFAGNSTYAASSDSKTFTITKAQSTVTVNCSDVTYTGAAQTPCTAAVTGAGGLNQPLTVSYSNNTNAGTATASASYAGDASHTSNSGSATFEIAKASSSTTVTCPGSVTYTGAAQTPCSASYSGVGGLSGTLTPTYSNNTNAGTATASASYAGDTNHTGSSGSKDFTIDKAASVTTVTCPTESVPYTGAAIEPCSAAATGAGGLNQSLAVSYSDNTNVGSATASASYAGDDNHTNSSGSTTFQIGSVGSHTTISCPASVTYSGSAQTPCMANVTGIGGLNQAVAVVYTNNTNAGTATAKATFDGDGNHAGSFEETTFVIDKADATISVSGYTGVYDRTAHGASGTATGIGGENPGTLNLGASFTNVPGGTAHWTFTGNGNYNNASGVVAIVITRADATINVSGYTGTYDGATHGASGSATGIGGEGAGTLDLGDSFTNVPGGTAHWTFTGNSNYNDASGDVAIVISKATSTTAVSCPANVTYDGSAQTPCTATATGAGGLSTPVAIDYNDNTNAGTATATATYAGDTNHFGSADTASFTIDQASSTVTLSCPASVTYTGAALEPCTAAATGAGGLNASVAIVYSNNMNAGTASALASYPGDANHTGNIDSATFTIAKAPSTVTVTCGAGPFTYNGTPQTPCLAAVTGAGGLNETASVSYSNNTNAGTASASASYAGDANHEASSDTENFTIAKANATINVQGYTGVYDGLAHGATGSATGIGGENPGTLNLGASFTNVSGGTVHWSFTGNSNYNDVSGDVAIVINKKAASVTPNVASKLYGDLDPSLSGTLTGFLAADNVTATYGRTPGETVGTYQISAVLAPAGVLNNYSITYNTAAFTINSWTFNGFYQPVDMSAGTTTVYNTVKSGSTVPIKFEVFKGSTELVSTSAIQQPLRALQVSCSTSATLDDIELTATGGTSLRYDTTAGQYIYNWQTPSGKAGNCYSVTISSTDGSSKTAYFKLK